MESLTSHKNPTSQQIEAQYNGLWGEAKDQIQIHTKKQSKMTEHLLHNPSTRSTKLYVQA